LLTGWLCLSYNTGNTGIPKDVETLYNKASRLFNLSNPTDATDSIALTAYQQVIDKLEEKGITDTILFFSYLNKGILLDINYNYTGAIESYLQAQRIKKINPQWSDSLLYDVWVHTGSAYFHLNNFDSASYYLLHAEALSQRFPRVHEKERLFNDLGVLYHENGNYLQSRDYFTHALDILTNRHTVDPVWVVNIQNNIAASCYKLGLYNQSIGIYQKICSKGIFTSQIFLNMGLAWNALGNYKQALDCFRKVNANELPGVFNEMAHTQLQLHRYDSAAWYLNRFHYWCAQKKLHPAHTYTGINLLYEADLLVHQQEYEKAINALQKAIIVFSGHFKNRDIYSNPVNFTGTFTSYRLFDALLKKATAFEQLYYTQKKEAWLQAAHTTYNSAISLLRYIEKSYDTDDAKLFLKSNSQQAFQQAFSVCLQLHALHPQAGYLEQAFVTGERSKATVMYAGLREKAFQKVPGIDPALIQQERNTKYNLARLSIKSDQTQDSAAQEAITKEKAGLEITLAQVQNKIEQNSSYYKLKYSETYPGLEAMRKNINAQQAIISFYTTPGKLHVFVITKSAFRYAEIDSFAHLQQTIINWLTALKTTESGRKFKGEIWALPLYQQLVKPVQELAGDKQEWIIIPGDILYYLPFESLPAVKDGSKTLLETTEISYQFSARFLVAASPEKQEVTSYSVLAFAPFVHQSMPFPHPQFNFMNQLAASGSEIAGLPGKFFIDSEATKQQFLKNINQYPVVHLATHAIADTGNSAASFIAFYPHSHIRAEDGLYLEELYSLNMDATRLIIISACETGNGQLASSEGVLSLTRGFAYAGCASIVNSLWKADDEATAAILHQFHQYLQKGYTKSKALQQAKLDYIHSNALHKTPDYWAHLILIGNTQPVITSHSSHWLWLLVVSAVAAGVIIMAGIKKGKKST
jgi:CHAT domain-containing protein